MQFIMVEKNKDYKVQPSRKIYSKFLDGNKIRSIQLSWFVPPSPAKVQSTQNTKRTLLYIFRQRLAYRVKILKFLLQYKSEYQKTNIISAVPSSKIFLDGNKIRRPTPCKSSSDNVFIVGTYCGHVCCAECFFTLGTICWTNTEALLTMSSMFAVHTSA